MKQEIIIHQVNLHSEERELFSKRLQEFENQFSYPLGDQRFHIIHGKGEGNDYFSFFEQMGEVYYFVALINNKIVGAGCAILRNSDEGKYWYLCDFKISPEHRGKFILEKMLKMNFFKCVKKSRKLIAVNMGNGESKGNGLLSKMKRLLWMFRIQSTPLNFHTWSLNTMPKVYYISSNIGKKDLIIEDKSIPLYHITKDDKKDFSQFTISELGDDVKVMACEYQNNDHFDKESISGYGILISIGFKNPKVSTVEI